eukprot:jgi/Mesvir1/18470/Mv14321-RA.1
MPTACIQQGVASFVNCSSNPAASSGVTGCSAFRKSDCSRLRKKARDLTHTKPVKARTLAVSNVIKEPGRAHQRRSPQRQQMFQSPEFLKSVPGEFRVFAVSDVHTDYKENLEWVEQLSNTEYQSDVMIVAGDVSDDLEILRTTLAHFKSKFLRVFFTPGNHDIWCRNSCNGKESLTKLRQILDMCEEVGVSCRPERIRDICVVPILGWYHESWDRERDIEGYNIPSVNKVLMDYKLCQFPEDLPNGSEQLAAYFDGMNDDVLANIRELKDGCSVLVTFSHFLPRQDLLPEKRMLFFPNLAKAVGSDFIERRIRAIHPAGGPDRTGALNGAARPLSAHIFGHTHFGWDSIIDGIRYIQAPLAYPRERKRNMNGGLEWLPVCIYNSAHPGTLCEGPLPCHWSQYYDRFKRDPENTQLEHWVEHMYKKHPAEAQA